MLFVVLPQVSRHPGPPYPGHDLTKTHPNLAGTPPGHATSPALSQLSIPGGPSYRFLKGWEQGGGVSINNQHRTQQSTQFYAYSPDILYFKTEANSLDFGVAMFFWVTLFCTIN